MSDPMRHLNEEEDRETAGEISYRTMVGARDHTKLHKKMRSGDVDTTDGGADTTTDGDDASTVKASDAGDI